ncbi:MAG: Lrp/AsnC family transcriptional regulator, partial [bacterium]|nr:Lrp/AsnC family transcriptional regulator [bacterium]
YITGKVILLDPIKVGIQGSGFFVIACESHAAQRMVEEMLMPRTEVQEIHLTGNGFELIVKARARTHGDLARLKQEIWGMKNVRKVGVITILGTLKETTDLPL